MPHHCNEMPQHFNEMPQHCNEMSQLSLSSSSAFPQHFSGLSGPYFTTEDISSDLFLKKSTVFFVKMSAQNFHTLYSE